MNPTDLMELSSLVRLSKGHDVNHQSLLLSSTKLDKALVQGVGVCANNGSDRWDTKPVGDLSQGGRDRVCHVDDYLVVERTVVVQPEFKAVRRSSMELTLMTVLG